MTDPTSRPLIISDCDEVLLHFALPFTGYLEDVHAITPDIWDLAGGMGHLHPRRPATGADSCGEDVHVDQVYDFFDTQQHRQIPVPGAREALNALAQVADIVILTNVRAQDVARRMEILAHYGMPYAVYSNQGGKGPAVARLAHARRAPVFFIDDCGAHHRSVRDHADHVHRLHFVADPVLAALSPHAPDASARIDHWPQVQRHIMDIL